MSTDCRTVARAQSFSPMIMALSMDSLQVDFIRPSPGVAPLVLHAPNHPGIDSSLPRSSEGSDVVPLKRGSGSRRRPRRARGGPLARGGPDGVSRLVDPRWGAAGGGAAVRPRAGVHRRRDQHGWDRPRLWRPAAPADA